MPDTSNFQQILSSLGLEGVRALQAASLLQVRAAQTMSYLVLQSGESTRLRESFRVIPEADFQFLLSRVPALPNQGRGILEFLRAESDIRSGRTLQWIARGVNPDQTPDLLILKLLRAGIQSI